MDSSPPDGSSPDAPEPAAVPAAVPAPLPLEFELQRAQGDAIEGPYDRITLQEMLYTGRLTGAERVRVPGESAFQTVAERAELAAVRERFHGESVRARGSLSDAPESVGPPPAARAEDTVAEAMQKAGVDPGRLALLVVGTVLVVVAVIVAVFVTQL